MSEELEGRRAAALIDAQNRALDMFVEIEQLGLVRPGILESELNKSIYRLSREKYDAGRHWHKRIVRAGKNTVHPYQVDPEDLRLAEDDIVFVDLGPVFGDWEADFGRTYVIGNDSRKQRLRDEVGAAFQEGKAYFKSNPDITGRDLYHFVRDLAAGRDWKFGNEHAGHLVGEFPHEKIHGDKVTLYIHPDNREKLNLRDQHGRKRHWILEIHFVDQDDQYGAFYEELLTL